MLLTNYCLPLQNTHVKTSFGASAGSAGRHGCSFSDVTGLHLLFIFRLCVHGRDQWVQVELRRQTAFGEFQAKKISPQVATISRSFSGNETPMGGRVVTYLAFMPDCRKIG